MVGKYQNVFEEIDVEYAKAQGIHILRRMSGGGTVLRTWAAISIHS